MLVEEPVFIGRAAAGSASLQGGGGGQASYSGLTEESIGNGQSEGNE